MPRRGISKIRLAQVALEIISLKESCENALRQATGKQKKDLTETIQYLDNLESLVARLNLLRKIRIRAPIIDVLGSLPGVQISP